ncbi:hypothetical protein AM587_10002805 [Phytophthora nicotianae]|uniref:Uncharacterized protein n=1 Tax=Phytophthora nicotianae TaxID=4792 RepID=A0A0W8C0X4_PHYNI|nr:hypothetical protein AM587_10002805 [Phytophthora nicotianae]
MVNWEDRHRTVRMNLRAHNDILLQQVNILKSMRKVLRQSDTLEVTSAVSRSLRAINSDFGR